MVFFIPLRIDCRDHVVGHRTDIKARNLRPQALYMSSSRLGNILNFHKP
jgi:hypothetical protein